MVQGRRAKGIAQSNDALSPAYLVCTGTFGVAGLEPVGPMSTRARSHRVSSEVAMSLGLSRRTGSTRWHGSFSYGIGHGQWWRRRKSVARRDRDVTRVCPRYGRQSASLFFLDVQHTPQQLPPDSLSQPIPWMSPMQKPRRTFPLCHCSAAGTRTSQRRSI